MYGIAGTGVKRCSEIVSVFTNQPSGDALPALFYTITTVARVYGRLFILFGPQIWQLELASGTN